MALSISEKQAIRAAAGWSDKILDYLRSVDEAKIYMNTGLVERTIGGRLALVRTDIDWKDFSCRHERLKDYLKDWDAWQARFKSFSA